MLRPDHSQPLPGDRRFTLKLRHAIPGRPVCLAGYLLIGGLLAAGLGCRSYQLGSTALYRPDIATIHVPIVETSSLRRDLAPRLTEAVVKQVEDETPYRLADASLADSFLRIRIVDDRKRVLGENRFDEPRDILTELAVEVTWTDRTGTPLMPRAQLKLARDAHFVPEGGQSITTAHQQLIASIARKIVDHMEMPW